MSHRRNIFDKEGSFMPNKIHLSPNVDIKLPSVNDSCLVIPGKHNIQKQTILIEFFVNIKADIIMISFCSLSKYKTQNRVNRIKIISYSAMYF